MRLPLTGHLSLFGVSRVGETSVHIVETERGAMLMDRSRFSTNYLHLDSKIPITINLKIYVAISKMLYKSLGKNMALLRLIIYHNLKIILGTLSIAA